MGADAAARPLLPALPRGPAPTFPGPDPAHPDCELHFPAGRESAHAQRGLRHGDRAVQGAQAPG